MATYASLVRVQRDFQNLQELAVVWQEVEAELADFEVELRDSYAVLGGFDFIAIFEAPDRDAAFQAALAMQRNGLDMQTMEVVTTEHFASLVDDL